MSERQPQSVDESYDKMNANYEDPHQTRAVYSNGEGMSRPTVSVLAPSSQSHMSTRVTSHQQPFVVVTRNSPKRVNATTPMDGITDFVKRPRDGVVQLVEAAQQ